MRKKIAVFCDGTWNTPEQETGGAITPTNIVKLRDAVRTSTPDRLPQVKHYIRGVGTHGLWDKYVGGGLGEGLDDNLRDAYAFVAQNFEPGDELYLFGFSRGAYTARSLAGLIRNSGILRFGADGTIADAMTLYRARSTDSAPKGVLATSFRRQHSHETRIRFLGVFDTVGALGIPGALGWRGTANARYRFHDLTLSSTVDYAYHAMAIDERRRAFKPTMWEVQTAGGQQVEQVWFPGVHCDVGGGYAETGLSDIACEWMAKKAAAAGLSLDLANLQARLKPDTRARIHDSYRGFTSLPGVYRRPIGDRYPDSHELLHPCVEERLKCEPPLDPAWKPRNALAFLKALAPDKWKD